MNEPTITCPNCRSEIKLTETIAAPLIEATRHQYEEKIAQKEADVVSRETALNEQRDQLSKQQESIDETVIAKLEVEREKIVTDEAKKARLLLNQELEQKAKEVVDLQEVLQQRDEKLAEAQKAQVDLIRKQRELDDAKREMALTIEQRVEETRHQYEEKLVQSSADVVKREAILVEQLGQLEKQKESIDEQVNAKLNLEREKIATDEGKKVRLLLNQDLEQKAKEVADLQEVLQQRDEKLAEAQKAQVELIRKQRELDDAKREMDLTIESQVQDSLSTIRDQAKKEAEDELKFKVLEKEHVITSMQKQIEELKRKAEQGSQQLQGEIQELDLEAMLHEAFPQDTITPVPKGVHGGDALHQIFSQLGQPCGTILWESKRTKNWSDGWLSKLRDDQRAAKAEIAVVVSQALPKGVDTFQFMDGIWVTSPQCLMPVAFVLRHSILEISAVRAASDGQQTKKELVYQYLTGPQFRHRIQAIVEKFSDMQDDLEKERRSMTLQWAKREKQIQGVITATAGMYGDLQGIAGRTLQEIDGLSLPLLTFVEAPIAQLESTA